MPSAALATTGTTLTATEYNYLPRGLLGLHTLTSGFTTTGTHTTYQDEGLTSSVTYAASRILRVSYQASIYPSGGSNRVVVRLMRGSTQLKEFFLPPEAASTTEAFDVFFSITFNGPASGATETFKAQMKAGIGNTAVSAYADANRPRVLTIEDLGSQ